MCAMQVGAARVGLPAEQAAAHAWAAVCSVPDGAGAPQAGASAVRGEEGVAVEGGEVEGEAVELARVAAAFDGERAA